MSDILLTVEDGVAQVCLNRPEALNSLSPAMVDELDDVLAGVEADATVKALVLSGAGRAFCTGADLKAVLELFERWPDYVAYLYRLTDVCRRLERLPIPTIARVHGYALAGGLELMLCCDIAIAAEEARIGDQHSNVGLIAGAGGIPRLVRRVGRQTALEILYTGRWLSGREAEALRLVLRAVPESDLDGAVEELTAQLRNKSRHAAAYLKRVVLANEDVSLESALNEERAALLEYFSTSDDPREGIASFVEKRPPRFS